MKAIELRYTNDLNGNEAFVLEHTSFEHELGEAVFTKFNANTHKNMTIIAREENMTDKGFALVCKLYNSHKGRIPARVKNRFECKVRLAICIMTNIGKLSADDQDLAYQAYFDKLEMNRNAKFAASMRRMAHILGTL